jgi:hypothetical protein
VIISKATRITAVTGAAVLSFGLAGPAFAGTTGSQGTTQPTGRHAQAQRAMTVAEFRAWVTQTIDALLAWIEKAQARVSASTVLTDQQKTDATTRLQAAHDASRH